MQNDQREAVARIIDPSAFLFSPDELPKGSRAQFDAFDRADRILALLSTSPLALGGQQGDSETLRVLLDNLVIAQTLSKDIRQKATDEACSYLYDRRTTPARAEAQDEGAAGEIVAWRETFIVEEEDGAAVGIVIDLPDGSQIWTGECSTQLLEDARAREESPEASGQYLIVAARDEPTRVIAQVATVDDGIALARAIAGHVSAHPSPTPAADADGVIRVLERICETQKRLYGNGTGLHLAMLDLCIDARAELSLYRAALKSTAAKEGGE